MYFTCAPKTQSIPKMRWNKLPMKGVPEGWLPVLHYPARQTRQEYIMQRAWKQRWSPGCLRIDSQSSETATALVLACIFFLRDNNPPLSLSLYHTTDRQHNHYGIGCRLLRKFYRVELVVGERSFVCFKCMGASREEATVFQSFDDLGRFGLRQACCNCDRASDRSCSIVQSIACDTSTGATDVCVKHAPVLFVWRIKRCVPDMRQHHDHRNCPSHDGEVVNHHVQYRPFVSIVW